MSLCLTFDSSSSSSAPGRQRRRRLAVIIYRVVKHTLLLVQLNINTESETQKHPTRYEEDGDQSGELICCAQKGGYLHCMRCIVISKQDPLIDAKVAVAQHSPLSIHHHLILLLPLDKRRSARQPPLSVLIVII